MTPPFFHEAVQRAKSVRLSKQEQTKLWRICEMDGAVITALRAEGIEMQHSPVITATIKDLAHARREGKKDRLSERDLANLPSLLAQPQAVMLDRGEHGRGRDLLYIFESVDAPAGKYAKVVVRAGYKAHMKTPAGQTNRLVVTNSIRSARYMDIKGLQGRRYKLLKGAL